jgi:hypothetical protein
MPMRRVAAERPDDPHVLTLAAEALMDLQPWDYWEADKVTPKGAGAEIGASLERARSLDPDHAEAAHLYIHAVEASADPGRAEAAADRLRATVFFCRFTKGFTETGGISRTWWPSMPISRAQWRALAQASIAMTQDA